MYIIALLKFKGKELLKLNPKKIFSTSVNLEALVITTQKVLFHSL